MSMSSSAAPDEQRGWLRRCVKGALMLAVLHATVATALIPILGAWTVLYAVFPPYLLFIAWDCVGIAPLFATLIVAAGGLSVLALRTSFATAMGRMPRLAGRMLIVALALWIPIGCGEVLRWALMHNQLTRSDTRCHDTRSLIASLKQRYASGFGEHRQPHAWKVEYGTAWLWSYRSLRFEPAPDWLGHGQVPAACFSARIVR
ncbi:MAG: hypothetical protein ACOY82_15885 [Pseudomonadota bacterium]